MLKSYIESLNLFSVIQLKEVEQVFHKKEIREGEFLIEEGEVCTQLAFIESGAFHIYRLLDDEKITLRFGCEGSVVSAYSSFITGAESKESIEAIKDSVIWLIDKTDIDDLSEKNHAWSRFVSIISDLHYLELERYTLDKQLYSAKERYEKVLADHPECVLESPLKHLAAYLGITPRHLSRIRRA